MTEKDLRKLSRKQLLELLLKQTERADQLKLQLEEAEKKLEDKTISEREAGTLAEAALKLNGIFEAADAAAAQYLENVKAMAGADLAPLPDTDNANAKAEAEKMIAEAEKKCAMREALAEKKLKQTFLRMRKLQKEIEALERLKENK